MVRNCGYEMVMVRNVYNSCAVWNLCFMFVTKFSLVYTLFHLHRQPRFKTCFLPLYIIQLASLALYIVLVDAINRCSFPLNFRYVYYACMNVISISLFSYCSCLCMFSNHYLFVIDILYRVL